MGIPEGIKVKILLINEILNKECMAEGEAKENEEAKAKPLEVGVCPGLVGGDGFHFPHNFRRGVGVKGNDLRIHRRVMCGRHRLRQSD